MSHAGFGTHPPSPLHALGAHGGGRDYWAIYPGRCPGLVLVRPFGAEDCFRRLLRDAVGIGGRVPGTSSLANIRCRVATAGKSVRASLRRLLREGTIASVGMVNATGRRTGTIALRGRRVRASLRRLLREETMASVRVVVTPGMEPLAVRISHIAATGRRTDTVALRGGVKMDSRLKRCEVVAMVQVVAAVGRLEIDGQSE